MANALQQIIRRKRYEVQEGRKRIPLEDMQRRASEADPPRNFFKAVTTTAGQRKTAVIAEIKRKSPSAGWMRPEYEHDEFDPVAIAKAYHRAGAAAISCLTDHEGFGGDLEYIRRIRNRIPLPVLRKDFIIDPWQLYEARAASADAVLLIAEALREAELVDLLILATELRMTSIVEVHSVENLLKVRPHIGFPHPGYMLLGINNRDLGTMTTDVSHTLRLVDLVDDRSILVSESGIRTPTDIQRLQGEDVRIILVGEHLMRQPDPGRALAEMLGKKSA
ncbi:MAG: indole-3-glycerol-phosphate synthase [Planctomycetes bacterium]|nr:indole-3-glycerol-phosphate synthase [Planctomycetota bacterium]NOG55148.1 indole-3-glycerol-phosphate synthase [Planctomycetota bacterium]